MVKRGDIGRFKGKLVKVLSVSLPGICTVKRIHDGKAIDILIRDFEPCNA